MRRLLAFVMCVSGVTLAVSWTRADEPAAVTTDEAPSPTESTVPARPSARPEIVRTEPGAYRNHDDERSPGDESSGGVQDDDVKDLARQLRTLNEKAARLAEMYAGRALDQARSSLQSEIARIEHQLNEVIAAGAPAATQPDRDASSPVADQSPSESRVARAEAEIARIQQRMAEILAARTEQVQDMGQILDNLREKAKELENSATIDAEAARQTIEAQIDRIERHLAERRERRDAADPVPERDAERSERRRERDEDEARDRDAPDRELHERLRHIRAAIEHLNAAGMHDVVENLQRHAREMAAAHARAAAAHEHAGESSRVRELAEQIGELRRELRRLRQEVTELRERHAAPPAESTDN